MATEPVEPEESDVRRVDPGAVERDRRLRAGQDEPAAVRHASTVLLLRDARGDTAGGPDRPAGVEVYVLRRRQTMAFAAGMYAFPGGSVDRRDADAELAWSGPSPATWAERHGFADERLARASVCAAVRETFEESGVLLAGPTPDTVVEDTTGPDWDADRTALVGHELSFAELLSRRGLVLRSDLLALVSHWITPRAESRRFDTRFFLAALPARQRTRDVSGEADRVAWVRPAAALEAVRAGQMRMMPPTYANLAALVDAGDVSTALASGLRREVAPVMPQVLETGSEGDARWVLPGEAGHDGSYDAGNWP